MWWEALNLAQKIFFCIATPATVLLIIQVILLLIGFGGGADADADGDVDVDVTAGSDADLSDGFLDHDVGLSVFTFRGLVAFFTIGGWVGFTFADGSVALAIILAVVCGLIALFLMAFILRAVYKLQSNGNINFGKAVGKIAEVYLTIPKKGEGKGKINITIDERFVEYAAEQNGDKPIPTGAKVVITAILGDCYVVEAAE